VVFWCSGPEYDEPDFWRWSARDLLESPVGIAVHLVDSRRHGFGVAARALASETPTERRHPRVVSLVRRIFDGMRIAAGAHMERALGIKVQVRPTPISVTMARASAMPKPRRL
jgi:hypothetical protein